MKSITPSSFKKIRDYVYNTAGIIIGPEKSAMVINRLWKRLELIGSISFESYLDYVGSAEGVEERSLMLDLLTTNETYFFREPAHFNFLRSQILPEYCGRKIKIWCAAASSGVCTRGSTSIKSCPLRGSATIQAIVRSLLPNSRSKRKRAKLRNAGEPADARGGADVGADVGADAVGVGMVRPLERQVPTRK